MAMKSDIVIENDFFWDPSISKRKKRENKTQSAFDLSRAYTPFPVTQGLFVFKYDESIESDFDGAYPS